MKKFLSAFALVVVLAGCIGSAMAADLTKNQRKELTLFSAKAMGLNSGIEDIKEIPSAKDVKELVATGINLNGLLCARVTSISPLKIDGSYEVSCIEYRGGKAEKSYILEAQKGTAFTQ